MTLVVVSAFLGACAQIALRTGALSAASAGLPPVRQLLALASSPGVWIGLTLYGVSAALWVLALSRVPVTRAYPVVSIGYIITAVAGRLFFDEPVSVRQALGLGAILAGALLVAWR